MRTSTPCVDYERVCDGSIDSICVVLGIGMTTVGRLCRAYALISIWAWSDGAIERAGSLELGLGLRHRSLQKLHNVIDALQNGKARRIESAGLSNNTAAKWMGFDTNVE